MWQTHDYIAVVLLHFVALVQAVPAYYGYRVYRLNGYARYWTEAWMVFIFVMLFIALRRLIVAGTFDPSCAMPASWIFDQLISTAINSGAFTAIAVLKYKFFAEYLEKK